MFWMAFNRNGQCHDFYIVFSNEHNKVINCDSGNKKFGCREFVKFIKFKKSKKEKCVNNCGKIRMWLILPTILGKKSLS